MQRQQSPGSREGLCGEVLRQTSAQLWTGGSCETLLVVPREASREQDNGDFLHGRAFRVLQRSSAPQRENKMTGET
ncbi:hypothetical protein H920_05795 [Fukomys damarensis]|uniref:Uncharacterized protein n=1 Tax=Fukomys damarensis TaxID=885580 RepID=A0A091DQN6_FUKDA|nr:hypothetical protein H920_05795 [Fukomys damarensis]